MCDAWLKSHLKVGTKKIDFPTKARNYIKWMINLRKEQSTKSMNLPWLVYVVNLEIEGRSYLQRHFENPNPIGLCVLDNTEDFQRNMQLSKVKFKDILNGILAIIGGSIESYYVLLCFLNKKDYV